MGIFMTRIDKRHVVDIKSKRIQQGLLQTQTAGTWCQTNPTPTQNQTEGGGITQTAISWPQKSLLSSAFNTFQDFKEV